MKLAGIFRSKQGKAFDKPFVWRVNFFMEECCTGWPNDFGVTKYKYKKTAKILT